MGTYAYAQTGIHLSSILSIDDSKCAVMVLTLM